MRFASVMQNISRFVGPLAVFGNYAKCSRQRRVPTNQLDKSRLRVAPFASTTCTAHNNRFTRVIPSPHMI